MKSESLQQQATSIESVAIANLNDEILNRVGHVTRLLHDSLRGLGLR